MTQREYDGMRVLVTGAASGVGEASVRLFAARGASVAVCDRDGDGAHRLAEEITAADGIRAVAMQADVADAEAGRAMVDSAVQSLGGLHVAHLNAATITAYGDFGNRGIRSNLVSPGVTDKPGLRASYSTGGRDPVEGIAPPGN